MQRPCTVTICFVSDKDPTVASTFKNVPKLCSVKDLSFLRPLSILPDLLEKSSAEWK